MNEWLKLQERQAAVKQKRWMDGFRETSSNARGVSGNVDANALDGCKYTSSWWANPIGLEKGWQRRGMRRQGVRSFVRDRDNLLFASRHFSPICADSRRPRASSGVEAADGRVKQTAG